MEMQKPIIGVPAGLLVDKNGAFPGSKRTFVNQDYLQAIQLAGGQPIVLPCVHAPEDIDAQLFLLDGLLLPGGADMDPLSYGEQPLRGLEDVYPDMDRHQLALVRAAWERGLPMFGICRGMQVINAAFGGTLHQDLDRLPEGILQHVQKGLRHSVSHSVDLVEDTRLMRILEQPVVGTNSFHHQAVKDLAPGFRTSAQTRDGIVEGIERSDGAPVFGVQWHPEGMVEHAPVMLRLFQELVKACHRQKARKPATC